MIKNDDDRNNSRYLAYRMKFIKVEFTGTAMLLLIGLSIVIFV